MDYPTLNYPPIHLRARRNRSGQTEVFDAVRGRWLVLTPEEWVRRHVVEHLITECGFLPQQIVEEYPVNINSMSQRADIVAMDNSCSPRIVVECKEPGVKLCSEVLAQAVRYNSIIRAPYIVITNGLQTFSYALHEGQYHPIAELPKQDR